DRVELVRMGERVLGAPPHLLRHHLEIRGLGILNVRDLYGATAVQDEARVDLVIELCEQGDERAGESFDRLGLAEATRTVVGGPGAGGAPRRVLGVPVPMRRVPVFPGRARGGRLGAAARNRLLKRAGHPSAEACAERLAKGLAIPET